MLVKPDFDVAIAGAGFSGLGMALTLKREGKRSFVVLEKAATVGGTWRENRYPGCACDVASLLYSFSFAPNAEWSRLYPTQAEIQAYLERLVDAHDLRAHMLFDTALRAAVWDDAAKLWRLETTNGDSLTARALVSAMGGLHTPHTPSLPGLNTFAGDSWHTATWPEAARLEGKRVALIGAGASAIQTAPAIAPQVAQLDLYQRTAPYVLPKRDAAAPRWLNALCKRAPVLQKAARGLIYALNEARAPAFLHPQPGESLGARMARAHRERQLADPDLRAKATPDYAMGCKRVLISDDYYPALARGNVDLIASAAKAITRNGVIDGDGVERPCDVLIFATGFKPLALNAVIAGKGGRTLADAWAGGPEAYLATAIAGFPNFFMLMGPNSGLGHNSMIYMIESQIAFIMDALRQLDRKAAAALEVKPQAQYAFNAEIAAKSKRTVWSTGCASWYLAENGRNVTLWPDFSFRFRARTRRIAENDFAFYSA